MAAVTYLRGEELGSERLDFISQFPDDPRVGVFIHNCVVDDAFGAVGVAQCGQRLLVVVGSRRHCSDHDRLAVPSQVVLQQPREHRVAVRHELRLRFRRVCERGDDQTQSCERSKGRKTILRCVSCDVGIHIDVTRTC